MIYEFARSNNEPNFGIYAEITNNHHREEEED